MELVMKTDMEKEFPAAIVYNHEELKAELAKQIEKYQHIVVTEDTIKESKADKANLNRLRTALEDKRKEVKRQCLHPYEGFEREIKELVGMVDVHIKAIDSQLKEFEKIKKEEKLEEIKVVYRDNIGLFEELVPLEKIWNPKWLNVSYKMSDIALEIAAVHDNIESGFDIIEVLETEFRQEIKDKFLETLDIAKALQENGRLQELREKQKAVEEKQQVQAYLQGQEQEEKQVQKESQRQAESQGEVRGILQEEKASVPEYEEKAKVVQVLDFRVWVTQEQKMMLRNFLLENNIKFGRVE